MKILFFCIVFPALLSAEAVYFLSFADESQVFSVSSRDNCNGPYIALKQALEEHGYEVKVASSFSKLPADCAYVICFTIPHTKETMDALKALEPQRCIALLLEPPIIKANDYDPSLYHDRFGTIFTMLDAMVDGNKYKKLYYPQPTMTPAKRARTFNEKKLLTAIFSNKFVRHPHELYTTRLKLARYFMQHHPHEFEFYGMGHPEEAPCYKGAVEHKALVYQNYKFAFCLENCHSTPGYVTEKIFDALLNRCVPLYLGAPNIDQYVPQECFIDMRQFSSVEQLYSFISSMDEATFHGYLKNAETFLASKKAYYFSSDYFVTSIVSAWGIA